MYVRGSLQLKSNFFKKIKLSSNQSNVKEYNEIEYWPIMVRFSIDHIRILGIGLELACNGG